MSKYLTCRFAGRLGNIVLEIYSTFLCAKQSNIDFNQVKFNLHYSHGIGTLDPNTLEKHPIKDYIYYCKDIILTDFLHQHFISNDEWQSMFNGIAETNFKDSVNKLKCNIGNVVIKPYQWKKIETINDLLLFRTLFNIASSTKDAIKAKYKEYFCKDKKNYAVHIRRTDYKLFNNGKYLQSKSNILANMPNIGKDNVSYVIFSDDIDWCKNNINGKNVHYHITGDATEDLLLMSCFDDIISGPNSTYAYVAKLLNTNIKIIPYWCL